MHNRPGRHAELLVHHTLGAEPGDEVVIVTTTETDDLAESLCETLGSVGAIPVTISGNAFLTGRDTHITAYLNGAEKPAVPESLTELLEAADAVCHLRAGRNASEFAAIDESDIIDYRQAYASVLKSALFEGKYVLTQVPTAAGAQLASMGTEEFGEYVAEATIQDWEAQYEYQEQLATRLTNGDEVRLVTGSETDIEFSISDNAAVNDDGTKVNLPGGEVYTAPVLDSIDGTVTFDIPRWIDGRKISRMTVEFEDGEIVDYTSAENDTYLDRLVSIDSGAARLGEFGVGMNRHLDRPTGDMALDEKMHGTVHFALGNAYEACVGGANERNESAIHVDMLVDMREDARMAVDGETILSNGEFRF